MTPMGKWNNEQVALIQRHEQVKDIDALKGVKENAEGIAAPDIAKMAQEAITRLEAERTLTTTTSTQQSTQVDFLGGSTSELEIRTEEDNGKIEIIEQRAAEGINKIKNAPELGKESKIKVDSTSIMYQIKSKFSENYFLDEGLQNSHKSEFIAFLNELRNGTSNPDVVNQTVEDMQETAIKNLYKQFEPQIKDLARSGNPSQTAVCDFTERVQATAGIRVPAAVLNKMLQMSVGAY